MRTFSEFLNEQPVNLKNAWRGVESSWRDFLDELRDHVSNNKNKYDTYYSKFGALSSEHPNQQFSRIVNAIEKDFRKMKEELAKLSAYEMI